ncbi:phosphoglycolate/pyridoxal phosphate phosphatase family protein [compost metagenome]
MYSLYLAKDSIAGREFILNNADLSIDRSIVRNLLEHQASNAIAIDRSLFNEESMKVTIRQNGTVSNISKKIQEHDSFGCSIDFYKFSASACKIFFNEVTRIIEEEKNLKDWTEVAMQQLFQQEKIEFFPCDISGLDWVEIDNYEDLALSDRKFSGLDKKINDIDNFFFDLDGTIYVGNTPIEGANRTIETLQQHGKNIFFLSNNSSKSKTDYVSRLKKFGIETSPSQIILSTDALIEHLQKERVNSIHVLGTNSLKKVLLDEGFQIDSATPEYVVIGYDTELNYQKLITACKYINEGTDILATHCDIFCPSEHGPIPDIGATLEMIRLTTGKSPKKVFGKPSSEMIDFIMQSRNLLPNKTIIVGDRLHTDIMMAKKISALSMLVLSGESTRDQLETSEIQPDFVLSSISDL